MIFQCFLDSDCCDPNVIKTELNFPKKLRLCFNIDVSNDEFYENKNSVHGSAACHPFVRSQFICSAGGGVREQFNGRAVIDNLMQPYFSFGGLKLL